MFVNSFFAVLFWSVPVAVLGLFTVSLILYLSAKRKNRRRPESVSRGEMKALLVLLIVSSVALAVLVTLVVGFVLLLTMAVAFM